MTEWVGEQRWTKHQEYLMLAIKSLLKDHEIRWHKESKCQSIQSPLGKKTGGSWPHLPLHFPSLSDSLIFTFTPPVIFTSAHWQIRLVRCWTLQCTLHFLFGFHTIPSFISLLILAKKALLIPAEVHLLFTCNYSLTFLPSESLTSGSSIYIFLHTSVPFTF